MDLPRKPADSNSLGVPSPKDESFRQPLGATGVFGAIRT